MGAKRKGQFEVAAKRRYTSFDANIGKKIKEEDSNMNGRNEEDLQLPNIEKKYPGLDMSRCQLSDSSYHSEFHNMAMLTKDENAHFVRQLALA